MKPLFVVIACSLLLAFTACQPTVPGTGNNGGKGYVPPSTLPLTQDTTAFPEGHSEQTPLDTADKTGVMHPKRPDSTNVMPPR